MNTAKEISEYIIEYAYVARKKVKPEKELLASHSSVLAIAKFLVECEYHELLNISDICSGIICSMTIIDKLKEKNHDKLNHDVFDLEDELLIIVAFMLAVKGPLGSMDEVFEQDCFLMCYSHVLPVNHPMSYPAHYKRIYAQYGYTETHYKETRKLANEEKEEAILYLKSLGLVESNIIWHKGVVYCVLLEIERLEKFNHAEQQAFDLLQYNIAWSHQALNEKSQLFFKHDLSKPKDTAATNQPFLNAHPVETTVGLAQPRRPRSLSGSSAKN